MSAAFAWRRVLTVFLHVNSVFSAAKAMRLFRDAVFEAICGPFGSIASRMGGWRKRIVRPGLSLIESVGSIASHGLLQLLELSHSDSNLLTQRLHSRQPVIGLIAGSGVALVVVPTRLDTILDAIDLV